MRHLVGYVGRRGGKDKVFKDRVAPTAGGCLGKSSMAAQPWTLTIFALNECEEGLNKEE